jgi:hypothetical protein
MSLTGAQRQPDRKAIAIHERMNSLVNPPLVRPID